MKASEIDWSKAPEWATGYGFVGTTDVDVWVSDDCYTYVGEQQSGRVFSIKNGEGWSLDEIRVVSSRPSVWNGTGLPPVGTVCEANMPPCGLREEYAWRRVKVVHGGLPDSACEILVYDIESTQPAWVDEFRPIRTPEQIKAEERKMAIAAIKKIADAAIHRGESAAEAVYDAGYRKVEGDKQ